MTAQPFDWQPLVDSAKARIAAAPGDKNAALDVLAQSAVALRGVLLNRELPDPERAEYLAALLVALEAVMAGVEPKAALHLTQPHDTRDERLFGRNLGLFIHIGRAVDEFRRHSQHRSDSPVARAKEKTAREMGVGRPTIDKVWTMFGSERGWRRLRDEVG